MQHDFYAFGTPKKISWVLKNEIDTSKQTRDHAEIYLDKITNEQSKYIALHVGIFWGVGTFRIKNGDIIDVMLDSKTMYEHLANQSPSNDEFIKNRTSFLNQLIMKRKLKINYKYNEQNLAEKLIK